METWQTSPPILLSFPRAIRDSRDIKRTNQGFQRCSVKRSIRGNLMGYWMADVLDDR